MYEVESIRRIVKEIDPRFDCRWEADSEEYVITQTSPLGLVSWFDSIRYDRLSRDFFDHMRRVIYINRNGDMARHLEENADKAEKRRERESENLAEAAASEFARPLYRALTA